MHDSASYEFSLSLKDAKGKQLSIGLHPQTPNTVVININDKSVKSLITEIMAGKRAKDTDSTKREALQASMLRYEHILRQMSHGETKESAKDQADKLVGRFWVHVSQIAPR